MTINFTSTYPLDGDTIVSELLATSIPNALTFALETDATPIESLNGFDVRINSVLIISNGSPVSGSGFFATINSTVSTIAVSITFSDPFARFDSYSTVSVQVQAIDASSSFDQTFSFRMEDTIAPVLAEAEPSIGTIDNAPDTPIFFRITDEGSGVLEDSLLVCLHVEKDSIITELEAVKLGVIQPGFSGSITKIGTTLDVLLTKDEDYESDVEITALIQAQDESLSVDGYTQFRIIDIAPPTISNLIPANNSINISEDSTISLTIQDNNGSGIDMNTLTVTINGISAVTNGVIQTPFLSGSSTIMTTTLPSSSEIETAVLILKTTEDLSSAFRNQIYVRAVDNRSNEVERTYGFHVRDYAPPSLENMLPENGDQHILPRTDIRFDILEERDGYGVNFTNLLIEIDGYSILNQTLNSLPIEGHLGELLGRTFENPIVNVDGYYHTPQIRDAYGIKYPGFTTTINQLANNSYNFVINPTADFPFDKTISVRVNLEDRGGNLEGHLYFFQTAAEGEILTTAFPDTGTYKDFIDGYGLEEANKFLTETGVVLTTNLPNTTTFYTTDGSVPRIDSYNRVVGTTQVFTQPILINQEGLNTIKYFSIDLAGTEEVVRQEVYMIELLPPVASELRSIPIVADIPFPTTIIPIETTFGFSSNELIRILDDVRPPILTKILTTNQTSNPPFIVVDDNVEKLKINRNARVEKIAQPIDKQQAIEFDTTNLTGEFYIGSDGNKQNQADAVFEQFRILNRASTDEEILADFTLLNKGSRFFNQNEEISLGSEFSSLEIERANMPDNTLVLLDLDGNVLNKERQGVLSSNTTALVDTFAAANDIIFTIKILEGESVDRELLREILTDFAPSDLNVIVRFEEIS